MVAILFVLLAAAIPALARDGRFPGDRNELRSPGGQFVVQNTDSDDEPHHTLTLLDVKSGTRTKLLDYPRHVRVLWQPDARAVAISDYHGTTDSTVLICNEHERWVCRDIEPWVSFSLTTAQRLELTAATHRYLEAEGWANRGRELKVKYSGYPGPGKDRFEFSLRCGLVAAPCSVRGAAGAHMPPMLTVSQAELASLRLPADRRICFSVGDRYLSKPEVQFLKAAGLRASSGPSCYWGSHHSVGLSSWRWVDEQTLEVSASIGAMEAGDHLAILISETNYRLIENQYGWKIHATTDDSRKGRP